MRGVRLSTFINAQHTQCTTPKTKKRTSKRGSMGRVVQGLHTVPREVNFSLHRDSKSTETLESAWFCVVDKNKPMSSPPLKISRTPINPWGL
ncbi:hypothetical protein PGT21_011664 [Puccinia graminis f. sp. tritici]|uniref:Uncharacterized protein n=1 Tax=Puccinia graminis f. sp. tritici TaxID=56615 RepID=A0A5B0Q5M6_PUCGR|nr:hypothetical protein PGT21_010444 [Puccinia graminis f. sp. tritici]KAA1108402.1 hypothetical protein PGT21_011664 [Puccinia graminis f. sp. tritici]KAA1138644.1 hypothetical protein PGTUg99_032648 [Puccinia graminis f. sp. tritici]